MALFLALMVVRPFLVLTMKRFEAQNPISPSLKAALMVRLERLRVCDDFQVMYTVIIIS